MFDGAIVALLTPFRDGKVDEKALIDLIEQCLAEGVNGFVPCGSTGESATLSHDEHRQVVEVTVKAVAGRHKVIAGTGSNNTQEAIALTRHAKAPGIMTSRRNRSGPKSAAFSIASGPEPQTNTVNLPTVSRVSLATA